MRYEEINDLCNRTADRIGDTFPGRHYFDLNIECMFCILLTDGNCMMGSELESGSSFNRCESSPPAVEEGELMLFISTPVLASDDSRDTCGCDGCSCIRLYALIILLTDPCDTFIPCSWSSRVIWFLPFPLPAKYADITFSLIAGSTGANITNYHLAT